MVSSGDSNKNFKKTINRRNKTKSANMQDLAYSINKLLPEISQGERTTASVLRAPLYGRPIIDDGTRYMSIGSSGGTAGP